MLVCEDDEVVEPLQVSVELSWFAYDGNYLERGHYADHLGGGRTGKRPDLSQGPLFAFKNDLERSTGSGSEKDGKAEKAGPDEERKTEPAAS